MAHRLRERDEVFGMPVGLLSSQFAEKFGSLNFTQNVTMKIPRSNIHSFMNLLDRHEGSHAFPVSADIQIAQNVLFIGILHVKCFEFS